MVYFLLAVIVALAIAVDYYRKDAAIERASYLEERAARVVAENTANRLRNERLERWAREPLPEAVPEPLPDDIAAANATPFDAMVAGWLPAEMGPASYIWNGERREYQECDA